MENNNQNANWQQALDDLNTAADQTNQTAQNVQPEQPVQPQQPVQDNSWFAQQNAQNTYDAGDFAVLPAKQKSNKTLIIVLVIVAAAILIGGGIFLLLSMNKSAGYEALERNYFSGLTAQMDEVADMTTAGADMKFTLTPGAAMTNGADVAPTTLKAKIHADSEALKAYTEMTYVAGDTDIASLKYWMDNETYYFQIPELSDVILKLDASALSSLGMGGMGGLGMEDMMTAPMMENEDDTIGALPSNPSDMLAGYTEALQNLDPEVAEKAFGLIADAYFETVKDCTKTSTGTLQCGEVSVNCDVNTITITMKDFMTLALNVLNKVEADAEIMDVLADFQIDKAAIASGKTYVEESIKELPEEEAKKVLLTMTVYSKGKDIVGRSIDVDGKEMRFVTANDGTKFATEFVMDDNGEEVAKFAANGTVDGEKYDGTFEITSENSDGVTGSFSLTLNDYVNGSITFNGDTDGVKQEIKLTIASSEKKFGFGMDLISDGASMMKLDMEMNEIAYEEPTMPTGTIADASNESDANLAKFSQDMTNGLTTIMTKLSGLEKPDLIGSLLVGLSGGMGNVA